MAYLLTILLFFSDELKNIMEELADIVLLLNLLVSFAMQGKQFALKYDLDDVVINYTFQCFL